MIVICPGCSGIDCEVIKREFKEEKIVYGCIGECGGRIDESIVGFVDGTFVEAKSEKEFIFKVRNLLSKQ